MNDACKISETVLASGHRAVILENSSISVTLLPEKGAEIHSLIYKPRAMDVLWKSPWGLAPRGCGAGYGGGNTEAAWMDRYAGGWQEIFPNGGDECVHKNATLNFHGEVSIQAWDYAVQCRIHREPPWNSPWHYGAARFASRSIRKLDHTGNAGLRGCSVGR